MSECCGGAYARVNQIPLVRQTPCRPVRRDSRTMRTSLNKTCNQIAARDSVLVNMHSYSSPLTETANQPLSASYQLLRLTYGLVPFLAGLDKFFNLLTDWEKYVPSAAAHLLPVTPGTFMLAVGIIEMIAGLAVLTILPRLGALVVTVWLIGVALSAGLAGYFDVAVRDLVMAAGAYTLAQLATLRGEREVAPTSVGATVKGHA